ncbi:MULTISPECIES: RodZ domain-containing protein [unclassified Sphingopyxis]|jgi:cytoskeleton protein RodZ|uniref:helix-turn-helix domain-containing protein n=1 Tax=unclassified Sphingopyxis TaxID=2614943 RepID=UPI00285A4866|nr:MULTISPECIES: RodZ domain-containing protein [unclassified Sphingopyxis]MDR6832053.1 cytoskeletal protein RodZ [Sphingopyxis sp. BE122]MDR7227795.1 cytoskeletal protein RodZ [Sphingopyxis sp. BE259]
MTDEDVAPEQGELAITRTGDRLRLAREAAGLSLADVATRTRITQRHLSAIEKSDFSELPGRTYVTGFARAYARAVDLPEAEVGAAVRRELEEDAYGARPLYEAYEPTDPARLPTARMTWTLVIVALLLASAYGVWRFLSVEPGEALVAAQNRAADASEAPQSDAATPPTAKAGTAAVAANAPVVLTGISEVWIGFDDAAGKTENWRTLDPGETYQVPPEYIAQFTLRTSIPQALKVTVGGRDVGAIGPADTLVKGISLKPADLVARAEGNGAANAAATASAQPKG